MADLPGSAAFAHDHIGSTRGRHEAVKQELSRRSAGQPDDDYARAKAVCFDEVQGAFTAWIGSAVR